MQAERTKSYKYNLAICAIGRDEGDYIIEWLEYYKLVGVDVVFFYDNESSDDTKRIIQPYIDEGYVKYKYQKGKAQQLIVYNEVLRDHKEDCRWIAFVDIDEFIQPMHYGDKIAQVVETIVMQSGKGAAGVGINWCNFGSSGLEHKKDGIVIENFVRRGNSQDWQNRLVKTICNPRIVKKMISPHYPIYKWGGYSVNVHNGKRQWLWFYKDVNYNNIRVNHYGLKSKDEFVKKSLRGPGDKDMKYTMKRFHDYDLNEIEDLSMINYAELIKSSLGKG